MKAVLHYLVLVGIPILGVLGLLRIGSDLKPPVSVGGEWQLELTASTLTDAGCASLFAEGIQPVLTVSQSGLHLVLELNTVEKTSFKGRLTELTITTTTKKSETVAFQATVDRQRDPNYLIGAISLPDCKTPFTLTAFRQPRQAEAIEGH